MAFSRRKFVGGIGTSVAALGSLGLSPRSAEAELVYQQKDWDLVAFQKLLKTPARVKQIFDADALNGGHFLSVMKNSLNGLHFGFGIPADQIRIVACMHGGPSYTAFDDSMWAKYKLGEIADVKDPETGKPATRNIFYPSKPNTIEDVEDPKSKWQDSSIQGLQARGCTFLSCHNATESQAVGLVKKLGLTVTAEEVTNDLQAHTVPGIQIMPAMVAAITLLQSEGHFTYLSIA